MTFLFFIFSFARGIFANLWALVVYSLQHVWASLSNAFKILWGTHASLNSLTFHHDAARTPNCQLYQIHLLFPSLSLKFLTDSHRRWLITALIRNGDEVASNARQRKLWICKLYYRAISIDRQNFIEPVPDASIECLKEGFSNGGSSNVFKTLYFNCIPHSTGNRTRLPCTTSLRISKDSLFSADVSLIVLSLVVSL